MRKATMQEVLAFEDDPALLDVQCEHTGIPLWALIRVMVLRAIISDMYYTHGLDAPLGGLTAGRPSVTMARSIMRNTENKARGRMRAAVCIFSTGVGNQLVDGLWFNRLGDHLALAHAQGTLMVEDHFRWRWPEPRHNRRVIYHAPMQARASVVGRLRAGTRELRQAECLVWLACARAQTLLEWEPGEQRLSSLIGRLARRTAALPSQVRTYDRLLARVRPSVLLVEEACYGSMAALLVAANRKGIRTAEHQHGIISAGHAAYNFAPAIRADERFRETLPLDFLSFGPWWSSQVTAPVRHVAIGNPHRSERLGHSVPSAEPRRTVLLLSDGTEFGRYLALAKAIAPVVARMGLDVRVRPHPMERSRVAGLQLGDVRLDTATDLYESLTSAHVVISEVSTGLFEAAGIADRILVWSTPKSRFSCPVHPFGRFEDASELEDALTDPDRGKVDPAALDGVWTADWRGKYAAYLAAAGVPTKGFVE